MRTEIHIEGVVVQPEGLWWERRGQQRGLLGSILRQSVQEGDNYSFWMSPISRKAARDHRLLAFKKSDLQQERSYDSIKDKVETTDY